MIELCGEIVEEGLKPEIQAKIEVKLGGKLTREEIDIYINNFIVNTEFVPEEIKKIGIIVIYDMGWNGCSTGRE